MEPKDFARVILRRKRTIATAIIAVALVSFVGSIRKAPQFVASCDVLFQATAYDPTDAAARPVETFGSLQSNAEIIKGPDVYARAAAILKTPAVPGALNVQIIQDTQIFRLSVVDAEPVRAGNTCNAYGRAYAALKLDEAKREYERLLRQIDVAQFETSKQLRDIEKQFRAAGDRGDEDLALDLDTQRNSLLFERRDRTIQRAQISNFLKSGINGGGKLIKPAFGAIKDGGNLKRDMMLGIIVGLMFGIGIALVREYLDDTMRDKESTQRELGIPVLAALPDEGYEGYEMGASTLEAARQLRATLGSVGFPDDKSVLVITSTLSKSRATTLAALAAAVAESGRSVLVIGSDLRAGRTHESFGVANTVGLANVARGQVPLERAIRPAPGLDNVYVLPCGPLVGNPGELLSSEEMAFTLRRARKWADVVLLDAPPVLAAADASVLGAYADGVLLVVSAGQTNRSQANEAKEQLVSAGARLLGAVLVGTDEPNRQGSFSSDLPQIVPLGGAWGAYEYGGSDQIVDWYGEQETLTMTARTAPRTGQRRNGASKKTAAAGVNKRNGPKRETLPVTKSPKRKPARPAARTKTTTARKPAARVPARTAARTGAKRSTATTARRAPARGSTTRRSR